MSPDVEMGVEDALEWRIERLRFGLWYWHAARNGEVWKNGIAFRKKTAERKAKLWRNRLTWL